MSPKPLKVPSLILFLAVAVPAAGAPLQVFVGVPPVQTLVERVGGGHVEVRTLVAPGQDPHSFEPSPRQISALASARLYVLAGVPFEHAWLPRLRAAGPTLDVLDARQGIALRAASHEHHGHHTQAQADAHVWTSPPLAKRIARNIRDRLRELDPDHARHYDENFVQLAAELDALDRDTRALLASVTNRRFMVFHPAWGYFADTYNLEQVAIEIDGKTPGARTLAALIDRAKRQQIRVVFVQPQFDRRAAERIARDIDGRVITIDPLAADYFNNLRRVARQIAETLDS